MTIGDSIANQIGHYAFIVAAVIAVILGLAARQSGQLEPWLWLALVILGIIVGLVNVSGKESKDFLLIVLVLVIIAYLGDEQVKFWGSMNLIGQYLRDIFKSALAFLVPAGVALAFKEAWKLASGKG